MAAGDPNTVVQDVKDTANVMNTEQRHQIVAAATRNLSAPQKQALAQQLGLGQPDTRTRDLLWKIVVTTFALALLTAVAVLSVGVFVAPVMNGTPTGTILAIFTGVSGFLSGLFVPSPSAQSGSGNTA